MPLSVLARRLGYRLAFRILQVRWVLLRPRVRGVKCVITDGDRVLLVRHTYGARAWDLPGGAAHRDEPPLHTARREMEEELGLGDAPWRELGELRGRSYRRRDTISIFGADMGGRDPSQHAHPLDVDPVEIDSTAWFERTRLPLWTSRFVTPILTHTAPLLPAGEAERTDVDPGSGNDQLP